MAAFLHDTRTSTICSYIHTCVRIGYKERDIEEEGKLFTRTKNEYCAGNVSSGSWILVVSKSFMRHCLALNRKRRWSEKLR